MRREVQVGDRVRISNNAGSYEYRITEIIGLNIYISPLDSDVVHLLVPGPNGYEVHGTNDLYRIEFLPGVNEIPDSEFDLTGDPYLDLMVLFEMDDLTLNRACQTSQYINSLCQKEELWKIKIKNIWGQKVLDLIPGNYLEEYKYLIKPKKMRKHMYEKAAKEDKPHLLEILPKLVHQNAIGNLVNSAIKNDSVKVLKWLHDTGYEFGEMDYLLALETGSINASKFLYELFPDFDPYQEFPNTFNENTLDLMKWLAEPPRNILPDPFAREVAITKERYDIVDWMMDLGIPLIQPTTSIIFAPISVLEWYKDRGFLPTQETANLAVTEYMFEVVDWLAKNGVYPTSEVYDILDLDHRTRNYPEENRQMLQKLQDLGIHRD